MEQVKRNWNSTNIDKERFEEIEAEENTHKYILKNQLRVLLGGEKYIQYVKKIFSNKSSGERKSFNQYEFKYLMM